MTIDDLRPGDIIVSFKGASWWNLIQRFFNWRIKRKALKVYGKDCVFPEANHNRVVIGRIGNDVWIFHWTTPTARFEKAESWLVDPEYSMVMHHRTLYEGCDKWLEELLHYDGSIYDIGQLIDIDLGFRLFDFGRRNYVCSVGVRVAFEHLFGIQSLFPESDVQETLPCVWANHPDEFEHINKIPITDQFFEKEPAGGSR